MFVAYMVDLKYMKKLNNQTGFSAVEALLILVIVGILGFTGWFVYHSQNVANKDYTSQASTSQTPTTKKSDTSSNAKTKAMATWATFSDATVGLTFKYPSDWGQAKLQTMNATPSNTNNTFYKIAFDKSMYLTVNPKASLQSDSTTFSSIKSDNSTFASSRHVFVNEASVVGYIVPSTGNQDAEIYAARAINLSKVDASDIALIDAHLYSGTCTQATYVNCYTPSELSNYQWLLESVSAL